MAVISSSAIAAALCLVILVVAAPRYVAVCGGGEADCASTSVAPAMRTSSLAILPISSAGAASIDVRNNNAIGAASVAIVGYFDTDNPGVEPGDFASAPEDLDMSFTLKADEDRTVLLADAPVDARSVLVQLGGDDGTASSPSCSADPCTVAAISVTGGVERIAPTALREALIDRAAAAAGPTESSAVDGGAAQGALDAVVDDVVSRLSEQLDAANATTRTPTTAAAPTSPPTPDSTPTATAAPAPPAVSDAPAEQVSPVPEPGPVQSAGGYGVPAGTTLTVSYGDMVVTQAGAVLDSLDIHGRVIIKAPDVTIRNSIIRGLDSGSTSGLLDNMGGNAGLVVSDTEITPTVRSANVNGVMGYNFELRRVNIHHVIDQIHLVGGNVVIADSWLHDNLHYDNDPNWNGNPSHDDSIQIQTGSNISITGNSISGARNSVVMMTQDRGAVSNVTISGNQLDGGACSINIAEKSYGPLSGLTITDNVFGRSTKITNCAVIAPATTAVNVGGSRYADGAPVVVKMG